MPEWGTLGEYIDRLDEAFVNCLGYEILHLVDREGPFDPERPVLEQRGYWFASDAYDKPALAMEPMRWEPGFHAREDLQMRLDPDLSDPPAPNGLEIARLATATGEDAHGTSGTLARAGPATT